MRTRRLRLIIYFSLWILLCRLMIGQLHIFKIDLTRTSQNRNNNIKEHFKVEEENVALPSDRNSENWLTLELCFAYIKGWSTKLLARDTSKRTLSSNSPNSIWNDQGSGRAQQNQTFRSTIVMMQYLERLREGQTNNKHGRMTKAKGSNKSPPPDHTRPRCMPKQNKTVMREVCDRPIKTLIISL